jgi:hypothetical protein
MKAFLRPFGKLRVLSKVEAQAQDKKGFLHMLSSLAGQEQGAFGLLPKTHRLNPPLLSGGADIGVGSKLRMVSLAQGSLLANNRFAA